MKNYFILFLFVVFIPVAFAQNPTKVDIKKDKQEKKTPSEDMIEQSSLEKKSGYLAQTNFKFSPLSLLIGVIDLQVDLTVSESWSVGPAFMYLNREIGDFDTKAWSLGIRGNYYLNRKVFTQGWYLGPQLSYLGVNVRGKDVLGGNIEANSTGAATTLYFGYHWFWETFNMSLGAGPVYYTMGKIKVKSENAPDESFNAFDGVRLALEYMIAWRF